MAFFKFRKGSDEPAAASVLPESVEAMRKRAKHRLLGAAVLVLVGVVGFPLLFDRQPRPISVDIPIEIPDRNKVKPLTIPAPAVLPKAEEILPTPAPAAAPAPASAPALEASKPALRTEPAPAASKPVTKIVPAAIDKPTGQAASTPIKLDDGGKAQALLEGKDADPKNGATESRFVVQVGAYADANRAREVRLKVEHVGLKTYTQVVETKEGRRIRVRVGPFAGKAEADTAAAKIKKLNLPATTLSL